MQCFKVLLPMFLLTLSSATMAEPYLGLAVGSSSYKVEVAGTGFEDKVTGTKFYGGYAFNKYIATELTYYNFAEASVGGLETSPGSGVFDSAAASMKGFGAYAVAMYPVNKQFNLMLKLGVLSWDVDLSFNNNAGSNSGTDAAYALAASYAFTKEFLATAEWEAFNTDNPEVSLLSVGFRFNFR